MDRLNFGFSTGRDLHIDQNITQIALKYRPAGMIADLIMPQVNVGKQSDRYPVFSRAEALAVEQTLRSPGTEARMVTRSVSSAGYFARNYALKHGLTLEDRVNMDAAYYDELVTGTTQYLVDKLMLDWEGRISALVTSTSNVGSSAAVASAWSDLANTNALDNINAAIDNIKWRTGTRPNRIVFGGKAWDLFRRNTTVRNLIMGVNNGGGYASRRQVADLFEVDQILVGEAIYNTANEALGTDVNTTFWGDNVLVYYTPGAPSRETPAFGYSFRWAGGGLPNMVGERHPYDTRKKAEEIEVGYYQDEKVVGPEYGFLITAVTSST